MDRDLSGMVVGYLTVVRFLESRKRKRWWLCRCECGEEIIGRADNLLAGRKKACGINGHNWRPGYLGDASVRRKPEWRVWCWMRERCRSPKHHHWHLYGGRGIRVCPRWEASFEAFYKDMGPRPEGFTLERIDVDGNYEPGNCRWATRREQTRNKRTSRYLDLGGRRRLLVDVAASIGMHPSVLAGRLKMGWSLGEALSKPVRPKRLNRLGTD